METCEKIKTVEDISLVEPKKYKVIFWNDDTTPMGVVIQILIEVFLYTQEDAIVRMLEIHHKGNGVAGTYIKSIAETRQSMAIDMSKKYGCSLKVTIEKE